MKKFPGLYIIAVYFFINGVGGFYQLFPFILKGDFNAELYSPAMYTIGFLVAGFGLILHKGWGRNFALFFNAISIFVGFQHLLTYYYGNPSDSRSIVKGLADFLIAGLIYYYLFKPKIKELFEESPVSWCILGLILFFHSQNQPDVNIIIDTFWAVMMIVSFAITGLGANQLRKAMPKQPTI